MRVTFDDANSERKFTPRADALHVISLRRANRRERSRYAANAQA